jgi:hypothetical protein
MQCKYTIVHKDYRTPVYMLNLGVRMLLLAVTLKMCNKNNKWLHIAANVVHVQRTQFRALIRKRPLLLLSLVASLQRVVVL